MCVIVEGVSVNTYVHVDIYTSLMYAFGFSYCFSTVPRPRSQGTSTSTSDSKDLLRKEVTKIFNEHYGN